MALGKRLIQTGGAAACLTETTDIFGGSTGKALYSMDYDASDTSGVYDGTPTNVDFGVGGQINTGARFNGSSSLIAIGSPIPNTDTNVAISAWVKLNSGISSDMHLTGTGVTSSGSEAPFRITLKYQSANTFRLFALRQVAGTYYLADNSTLTDVTMNADVWYHVVWSYNATGRQLSTFLNGTPIDANKTMGTSGGSVNDSTTVIGSFRSTSGPFFDGTIDQLRIFSSTIDSTQASTLAAEQACVHTATTTDVDYPVTNAAYYKLDNSAEDSKGTNDGTETDIEYRFGRYGQAAVFNGSSSLIAIGSPIPNTDTNVAISAWVKLNSGISSDMHLTGTGVTSSGSEAPFRATLQYQSANTFTIFALRQIAGSYRQVSGSLTNVTMNADVWYHVVWSYNSSTHTLSTFLNGNPNDVNVAMESTGSSFDNNTTVIGSFRSTSGPFFDGSIDQVRIFTSALSAANVLKLAEEKPETDTSNFKTVLYEGTGASQYISNVGIDLETSGGLLWIKNRDQADNHTLVDSVRGISTSGTKYIASNTTDDEETSTNMPVSLEKNGFFVQGVAGITNTSGEDYVSWVFKGGGTPVSNTDGSITSSVSANTAAGFSIVSFTGNDTVGATVGHGLSSKPQLIFFKARTRVNNWGVYAEPITADKFLVLNDTAIESDSSSPFNDTEPTSSIITLARSLSFNNVGTMIAYCFHSVAGYSKIDKYIGNNSSTNQITGVGFKPSFLMIKKISNSGTGNWLVYDSRRDTTNAPQTDTCSFWNLDDEDFTTSDINISFDSDGFTLKGNNSNINGASPLTYLYMAIK